MTGGNNEKVITHSDCSIPDFIELHNSKIFQGCHGRTVTEKGCFVIFKVWEEEEEAT